MRGGTIGILISSPIIKEGLKSILRSGIDGCRIEEGPWDYSKSSLPGVIVTDIYNLSACPEDVKTLGITDGSLPREFAAKFFSTALIYDTPDEICSKIIEILKPKEDKESGAELSPREKDVIMQIVKGFSNKEIASAMNVSVNTVMTHRRNIATKLKIHSPAGLTIYAIATGLVRIEDIQD